jgi:hypothetical protein
VISKRFKSQEEKRERCNSLKLVDVTDLSSIAAQALEHISELYAIEQEIRGRSLQVKAAVCRPGQFRC